MLLTSKPHQHYGQQHCKACTANTHKCSAFLLQSMHCVLGRSVRLQHINETKGDTACSVAQLGLAVMTQLTSGWASGAGQHSQAFSPASFTTAPTAPSSNLSAKQQADEVGNVHGCALEATRQINDCLPWNLSSMVTSGNFNSTPNYAKLR